MNDGIELNAHEEWQNENPFQEFGEAYIRQAKTEGVELAEPHWCVMPLGPIGHVDEVNGPGAGLVRGFVPTKHEVLQLAKHWSEIEIDLRYFGWVHQTFGSDWSRRMTFASMRLRRMQECLGVEVINKVYEATFEEFGKRQNPELWAVYIDGDEPPIASEPTKA